MLCVGVNLEGNEMQLKGNILIVLIGLIFVRWRKRDKNELCQPRGPSVILVTFFPFKIETTW